MKGHKQKIDPILLEVFRNLFNSISDEMEVTLIRTAYSTNIKDRRDCACGIYNVEGDVITQSELATPVHLGTMPPVVKAVLEKIPLSGFREGDAVVVNSPYPYGPGHLNDIAVVAPFFYRDRLVAFFANQAHHVDMGGFAPGSMPFGVSEIYQEGLQIPPVRIQERGAINNDIIDLIIQNVRTKKEGRGDLLAQLSAIKVGQDRYREIIEKYGAALVERYTCELLDYAERMVRAGIRDLPGGKFEFTDYIEGDGFTDDLIKIHVSVNIEDERIVFDFSGSHRQVRGPINCRWPSVAACVQYVVKSILDPCLPTNAGAFRPIEIIVEEGSLLNCRYPAALCNSNLITTQRIVDVLLGAFYRVIPDRVQAASQGTMNILTMGGPYKDDDYFTFVETYGGGQGAMHDRDGDDGIQNHMTNTRNAPVEVIENNYPVLVSSYGLITDSGGPGRSRGGMGINRKLKILSREAKLTIGSDREKVRPWGLCGGKSGSPFSIRITGENGKQTYLGTKTTTRIKEGDTVDISTPGGGGWGDPLTRSIDKITRDINGGLVTPHCAEQEYGVVFKKDKRTIDIKATEKYRKEKRS